MRNSIFWPLVAQVALVALVTIRMYVTRISEIRARRLNPQVFATTRTAGGLFEDIAAADNFRNLFEVPVLFFAVCCALAITDTVTSTQIALAWIFVGLRAAHSVIHVTYNRVLHRFAVYIASTLCVFAMWALFAVSLSRGA